METGGRIRPLFGLYRETGATVEFLDADVDLRSGAFGGGIRPHWFDAWQDAGGLSLCSPARAEALGARWYAACDADGNAAVTELPGVMATGVTVAPHADEEAWHRAAVKWWVALPADASTVPLLWPSGGDSSAYPVDQSAAGVSLHTGQDSLTVRAEAAGWAWLRVPWDPDWHSTGDHAGPQGRPRSSGGLGGAGRHRVALVGAESCRRGRRRRHLRLFAGRDGPRHRESAPRLPGGARPAPFRGGRA